MNRGMTIFIAVVVMGILLFISFAIVNIAMKSTLFASSGRDSQFAFYAGDAGLECALYWDAKFDPSKFATSTGGSPINCGGAGISTGAAISGTSTPARIGGGGDTNPASTFGFIMNTGSNSVSHCTVVTVLKYYDDRDNNGEDELVTYIKSRGYNTCADGHPRRIERGIEVTY